MKYLYLDTSRLRDLANNCNNKPWDAINQLLRSKKYILVLSLMHLFEFSSRKLSNQDPTANYLDSLDIVKWLPEPYYIFKEECRNAVNYLMCGSKGDLNFFFDSFADLLIVFQDERIGNEIPNVLTIHGFKYELSTPRTIPQIIDFLIKIKFYDKFKLQLEKDADFVTQMNKDAALWKNPDNVLKLHIKDYMPERNEAGDVVSKDDSFLDKLLSIADSFMPSLKFANFLERIKFGGMKVEANDFIDEYHASYTPYCDTVMLDKGTCGRVQQTKSIYVKRIVSEPQDLLKII
ncbi:hypothetical protein KAX97_06875 [candidate division WOR-3 bacterium]|nr:hypothetical protein [candidate division WOR-3 bacterium]